MSEQVRVGIIGTSWWADMMYLPSLQNHPAAEVVAICGRNREHAEEMAQKYAIPHVYTDYRTLIEHDGLEALIVSTPDDLHYPMTMAGLDAGLHVLCEKPLALNADQARSMLEKAKAVGVKHMVLFTWRYLPTIQYLFHLLEQGYLGRCYHASFRFFGNHARLGDYRWRFDGQRANGILSDLGAHAIDLARLCCREVARVHAHLATLVARPGAHGGAPHPTNDSALLALEFASGAQGSIHVSALANMADRVADQQILLHGEAGSLEVDFVFGGRENGITLRGARHDEEEFQLLPVPEEYLGHVDPALSFPDQFTTLFTRNSVGARQFVEAIRDDQPVWPTFGDGLKAQQVIDAALESHRRGVWVDLPA